MNTESGSGRSAPPKAAASRKAAGAGKQQGKQAGAGKATKTTKTTKTRKPARGEGSRSSSRAEKSAPPPAAKPAQRKPSSPPRNAAAPPSRTALSPLIVGIGASAGGLDAFKHFFAHMPPDSDMAFVLVQHLSPEHHSMLAELLGRGTRMGVREAEDGEAVQAGHVYVIPPDATLTIADGALQVSKPAPPRQHRWPIDTFFTSLARDQGEAAACVVLSGTGSDGTRGLRAVKESGGLTLAQAGYDHVAMSGMPANAAATGLVDEVLPVEDMPERLLAHHRLLRAAQASMDGDGLRSDVGAQLQPICAVLRVETGHDFSQSKEKTLLRRIQRRMQVRQTQTPAEYLALLRRDTGECGALFGELLIGVTEFFRDPAAFQALRGKVLPALLGGKGRNDTLRVWVVGCATGEEAYSVAIALCECMGKSARTPKVQLFATDIDERAIAFARSGRYRAPLAGVSAERCARWFTREDDDFVVNRSIREMCVFSPHSAIKDPPFSRLDLITCRNLMIYFKPTLQERLTRLFHYALRAGGYLMLGPSEGMSRGARLFTAVDKKHRLFARRDDVVADAPTVLAAPNDRRVAHPTAPLFAQGENAVDRAARRALEKYSPAFVVIDENHDIRRFAGDTGRYLGPSSGAASLNLFALLHRGLRGVTRSVVKRAFVDGAAGSETATMPDRRRSLRVIAELLKDGDLGGKRCVVAFVELPHVSVPAQGHDDGAGARALEQELESTRAQLQAVQEQHETLDEEMKSANEEYQSVNEELQSSNEELETSKEELQSVNEELQTVNAELQAKNTTLTALASDLQNLMESTQVATLFLDAELRIRSYTPATAELFHLRKGDSGRPITEISARVRYPELREDVAQVLRSLGVIERTLREDTAGTSYLLRMRPYRTVDDVIDGVVLTFVDISEREAAQVRKDRTLAGIVESSQDAIIGYGADGVIGTWNVAAERLFGYRSDQAVGKPLTSLVPIDVALPEASHKTKAPPPGQAGTTAAPAQSVQEVAGQRRDGRRIDVSVTNSPIRDANGNLLGGALIAHDNAERVQAQRHRELLLGELNHRVKNTLAGVQAIAQQTLTHASSLEDFGETFMARLLALSATHNLLAREIWGGAQLRELILAELAPFQGNGGSRVEISGDAVRLAPKQAVALSMAVHELATNAVKYGALSTPDGRVAVGWETRDHGDTAWLHLNWTERNGPPVTEPTRRGFGSRLIIDGLALELDGEVQLQFERAGVICRAALPLHPAEM
ncbi:MAG: chemotaxis protein CheB [Rhodanobacteraceae bacterium]